MIFVDTSGIYAAADDRDPNHDTAVAALDQLLLEGEELLVSSYVLVEAAALLQRRLGLDEALRFLTGSRQDLRVHWITATDHLEAVELLAAHRRRGLSLVDCASFIVMQQYGLRAALAFDADFEAEGFALYPASAR